MNAEVLFRGLLVAVMMISLGCSGEQMAEEPDGDAGVDGGMDAGVDGGVDAGLDGGTDAGVDGGMDAGVDGGTDAGVDVDIVYTNASSCPATDDLGRMLPAWDEAGDLRPDKLVAIFYWTWHAGHSVASKNYNLSEIITDPAMVNDWDHPQWAPYADGSSFFWGEPLMGYYDGKDEWVIRKHLELLGAAGVDVLFYDNTNGSFDWKEGYEAVARAMEKARADGVTVPQFAFMLNFAPIQDTVVALVHLYDDVYSQGRYQDSWFIWDGKPVIMAYPDALDDAPPAQSAGMRFSATAPFTGISLSCPSWNNNIGNLTLRLYGWQGDYDTSVSGAVLAEQTFVNFADNQYLELSFAGFPDGEYLTVLCEATEVVGVWKYAEDTPAVTSYFNGIEVTGDYRSRIRYAAAGVFTDLTTGDAGTTVPVQIPEGGYDPAKLDTIRNFFTFRPGQPDYEAGPSRNDQWGWLENYPQHGYVWTAPGQFEWMTVGVAQNWSEATHGLSAMNGALIHGRSYTDADGFSLMSEDSYRHGYNIQEQWERALSVDPDIVFVTGWNEWVVGRFETWMGVENAFPDQFDLEHSRDIEPMKGGFGDNYYYQLVANIRRFKGMQPPCPASAAKTIVVDGNTTDWGGVGPGFVASRGNTDHRDGYGYVNRDNPAEHLHYTNTTGRNDIVLAKVARDDENIYFYVRTSADLTSPTDAHWMQLLLDMDRSVATGWEGYGFMVDAYQAGGEASLMTSAGGWNWSEVTRVPYAVAGNEMELAVPRSALGLNGSTLVDLEFKWIDNVDPAGDIMTFYLDGDVAPLGRFNFRYFE